jgi:TonB family protein
VFVSQGILRKETFMNRTFRLGMTLLVSGCAFSFAQTTAPPTEQKPAPPAASSDNKQETSPKVTAAEGPFEILTDTMGVDFGPYLRQVVLPNIRKNWHNLIPEQARAPLMKKGRVIIEFAILKDGQVAGMKLVSTSGDVALDRGAWAGITASNPFLPLPTEFGGQFLKLRFSFYYNPDKADLAGSATQKSPSAAPPVDRVSASATETVVRLSEILISTPQPYDPAQVAEAQHKAEQVRAAIGRGGTFADIARANSQGPTAAQGGDIGCFSHDQLARSLEELVFRMQVGDVSDVVRTKQGFVIIEVTNRGADRSWC